MGGGEAPLAVAQELRYLGSMLSKNLDDSVTMIRPLRIRLARTAFTKLQKASTFGTRRVALESEPEKSAYESLVLSLLSSLYVCTY